MIHTKVDHGVHVSYHNGGDTPCKTMVEAWPANYIIAAMLVASLLLLFWVEVESFCLFIGIPVGSISQWLWSGQPLSSWPVALLLFLGHGDGISHINGWTQYSGHLNSCLA
jgi:hypothetical protein